MGFVAGVAIAVALMAVALGVTIDDVAMGPPTPLPSAGPLSPHSPVIAVTATIRAGKGQPAIDPARVEVVIQGVRVTGGARHYDPATGRFSLNLTIADAMAVAPPAVAESAPKTVTVSVRDGDRDVVGEYRLPEVLKSSISLETKVGYTDRRGRFIETRQDDPVSPAPYQWHTQIGAAPAWPSPLSLAVDRRWPAPTLGANGVRLTESPDGRVDLMPYGKGATTWATWEPDTGAIVETHTMHLDGHRYLSRARRGLDGLVTLSFGNRPDTAVEWRPGGKRMPLVYDTNDVQADRNGVLSLADDGGLVVDARDWTGRLRWRAYGEDMLPGIGEAVDEEVGSLTPLPDGSVLVLQTYRDDVLNEASVRFLVAHIDGRDGRIRYARTMNVPTDAMGGGAIVAGTAVRFGMRELAVLTIEYYGREQGAETMVIDVAEPTWRPIARFPAAESDAPAVYGAVAVGDRLVVGTGDAIVVLSEDTEIYGPPPP